MSDSEPNPRAPRPKRKPPWSVFIAAAIFFAIGTWLYLDLRREVKDAEEAAKRPPVAPSARPKILGLDIIPQLAESNEAKLRPAAPASAPASGSVGGSAAPSAAPSASTAASASSPPAAAPSAASSR